MSLIGKTTTEQGGSQAFELERFDTLPAKAMLILAQCRGYGTMRYGAESYKGIALESHVNHAIRHLFQYLAGDRSEPHLVNAMTRATFAVAAAIEAGDLPASYEHPDLEKVIEDYLAKASKKPSGCGKCGTRCTTKPNEVVSVPDSIPENIPKDASALSDRDEPFDRSMPIGAIQPNASDLDIYKEASEVAAIILKANGFGMLPGAEIAFSENPRARVAWAATEKIFDHLFGCELHDICNEVQESRES